MANTVQLTQDGNIVYPITDVSCVMGLDEGAITEAVLCWDGASTPVVANIPAGVVVTYNNTTYTGTLAASADTVGKIYMVATGTSNNYNRYMTFAGSPSYVWQNIGDTTIELSGYATEAEVTELEAKVGKVNLAVTESGFYIRCDAGVGNAVGSKTTNSSYCYIKTNCSSGDKVVVTGVGANQGRLWCFADSNNIILSVANASVSGNNLELTAPANSSYLIINSTIAGLGTCSIESANSIPSIIQQTKDDLESEIADVQNDVNSLRDDVKGTYQTLTPTIYESWYVDAQHRFQDISSVPQNDLAIALYDVEGFESLSVNIPKNRSSSIAFDNALPVSGTTVAAYETVTSGEPYSGTVNNPGYKYMALSYEVSSGVPSVVTATRVGGLENDLNTTKDGLGSLEDRLYQDESVAYKNETEEAGDANYQVPEGSGLVHLASTDETFNRVGVGIRYANKNEDVSITLKMGASVTASGGIILKQFTIKSSELSSGLFYIDLDEKVTLPAGQYLWVYSSSSTYGVPFRVWSNNSPGTRVGMYYAGGINTVKYSTAFRLLVREGDILDLRQKVEGVLFIPSPDIVTITDLYAVNGRRIKFYYNTFINGLESRYGNTLDGLTIEASCSTATIGNADNEGFEIFGVTNGTYVVNISIYDSLRRLVSTFAINVHIGDANDLSGKNILMIGDSWTDPSFYNVTSYPTGTGYAVNTAMELAENGSIANFVGSKFAGNSNIYCEGRGGWAWDTYVGQSSPFYHNGALDFAYYREQIGLSGTFDYVTFQLGVNDCLGPRKSTQGDWQGTLDAVSALIDAVLEDSPLCKIIINPVGLDAPTNTGWTSLNGLSVSKQIYQKNVYDLSRHIYNLVTARADYGTKVWMGQSYFGVNRWYGYGFIDARKRFFKVDTGSMSAADLAILEGWDFKTNPKFVTNGSKEFHAEGYEHGYLIATDYCRYSDWNSHIQQFVNDYSTPQNSVPSAGSLSQTSGTGLPTIPFTECVIENNDLQSHYFMNATHPYDYGFTQLGRCLAHQLLLI